MKSFKQFLGEKFEFEKHDTGDDSFHAYKFKMPARHENEKDSHGVVMIMHHPDKKGADLHFATGDNRMDTTGEQKGRSARIISTVKHIASQHAQQHGIKHYEFHADANEPSRQKLYNTIAKKHNGSLKNIPGEKGQSYRIPVAN